MCSALNTSDAQRYRRKQNRVIRYDDKLMSSAALRPASTLQQYGYIFHHSGLGLPDS